MQRGKLHVSAGIAVCADCADSACSCAVYSPARRAILCLQRPEPRLKKQERGIGLEKHPIESLMGMSMESIQEMVDVNTVVRET